MIDPNFSADDLYALMTLEWRINNEIEGLIAAGNKWAAYRIFYKEFLPQILNRSGTRYGIDPYFIDWHAHFTPIEEMAWQTIRGHGLPFYPQFPVANFFVDFGDPVTKIAIECDGKAFHDPAKDLVRDQKLNELGWRVFRIKGRECVRPGINFEVLCRALSEEVIDTVEFNNQVREWATSSSDGLITAIGWHYYGLSQCIDVGRYLSESLSLHSFPGSL